MAALRADCCVGHILDGDRWSAAAPVGSFRGNPFGLYDTQVNVTEWTSGCSNASYERAPRDGSAWERGDCFFRMHRGGSLLQPPEHQRASWRRAAVADFRLPDVGFRVPRDL